MYLSTNGATMLTKVLLIALVVVSASATFGGEHMHKKHELEEKCMSESGITREDLKNPDLADEKTKCFGACVMKGMGCLDDDNVITVDNVIQYIPLRIPNRDNLITALTECAIQAVGENQCDVAGKFFECLDQKDALPPMFRENPPPPPPCDIGTCDDM